MLDSEQLRRYSRTIALPEIGEEGQARICAGSALIVGAGALGSVAAVYLAAAGVGRIGVADFDTVDVSNLQRQVAYSEASAGKPKVSELASRMSAINSGVEVVTYNKFITQKNAAEIFAAYDVVIEGSDNPSTKHLVTKTCSDLGKPCVVGGVSAWSGQVMTILPGDTAYNDIFGDTPSCSAFAPCGAAGVIGPLPGIVGAIQATEALKLLAAGTSAGTGSSLASVGTLLRNRLLVIDALTFTTYTFSL
jgi:adenylyltransferase/sulfurtransferase